MKSVKAQPIVRLMNAVHGEVQMQVVGLGTGGYGDLGDQGGEYWDPEQGHNATVAWLKIDGRRIDTSGRYEALPGVGTGWVVSGVLRSEIFITSKIEISDYDGVLQEFATMIKALKTDYVDLLLIHWPGQFSSSSNPVPSCKQNQKTSHECRIQSWRALETLFHQERINYFFAFIDHR